MTDHFLPTATAPEPIPEVWRAEMIRGNSSQGKGRRGELSIVTGKKVVLPVVPMMGWEMEHQSQGRLRGLSSASSSSSTAYTTTTTHTHTNIHSSPTPSTPFSQSNTLVSSSSFSRTHSQMSSTTSTPSTLVYASYPGMAHLRGSAGEHSNINLGQGGKKGEELIEKEIAPMSMAKPLLAQARTQARPTPSVTVAGVDPLPSTNTSTSTGKGWTGLISKLKSKSSNNLRAKMMADHSRHQLPPPPALPTSNTQHHSRPSTTANANANTNPAISTSAETSSPSGPLAPIPINIITNRPTLKRDDTKRSITALSNLSKPRPRRKTKRASEDSFECGGGGGGGVGDDDVEFTGAGVRGQGEMGDYGMGLNRLDAFGLGVGMIPGLTSGMVEVGLGRRSSDASDLGSTAGGSRIGGISIPIPDVPAIPTRFQSLSIHTNSQPSSPFVQYSPVQPRASPSLDSQPQPVSKRYSGRSLANSERAPTSITGPNAVSPIMNNASQLARLDTTSTTASGYRAIDGGWTREVVGSLSGGNGHGNANANDWNPLMGGGLDARSLMFSGDGRDRYPASPTSGSANGIGTGGGKADLSPSYPTSRAPHTNPGWSSNYATTPLPLNTPSSSDGFDFALGSDPFGVDNRPFDEDEFHKHVGASPTLGMMGGGSSMSSPNEAGSAFGELLPPRAAFSNSGSGSGSSSPAGRGLSGKSSMESLRPPKIPSGMRSIRSSPSMNSLRKFGQGLRDGLVGSPSSSNLAAVAAKPTAQQAPTLKHSRTSPNIKALGKSQLGGATALEVTEPAVIPAAATVKIGGGLRKTTSMFFRQAKASKEIEVPEIPRQRVPGSTPAMPEVTPPTPNPKLGAKWDNVTDSTNKQARPKLSLGLNSLRSRPSRKQHSKDEVPTSAAPSATTFAPVHSSLSRLLPPVKDSKSLAMPSLPSNSSFSDLYRELGVSPPASDDDEDMPYSPSVQDTRFFPRNLQRQSIQSIASLAPSVPLPVPPPLKLRSFASTPQLRSSSNTKIIEVSVDDVDAEAPTGDFVESPIDMVYTPSEPLSSPLLEQGAPWTDKNIVESQDAGVNESKRHGTRCSDLNRTASSGNQIATSSSMSSIHTQRGREAGGTGSRSRSRSPSVPRRRGGPPVGQSSQPRKAVKSESGSDSEASSSESDDVPLAQRNPSALKAQKSLRAINKKARKDKMIGDYLVRGPSTRSEGATSISAPPARAEGAVTPVWDGEGGVPAGVLVRKLSELLRLRDEPKPTVDSMASGHEAERSLLRQKSQAIPATVARSVMTVPALARRRTEVDMRSSPGPPIMPAYPSAFTHASSDRPNVIRQMSSTTDLSAKSSVNRTRQASGTSGISSANASLSSRPHHGFSGGESPRVVPDQPRSRIRSAADQDNITSVRIYSETLEGSSRLIEVTATTTAADIMGGSIALDKDKASDGRGGWAQWTLMMVSSERMRIERPVRAWEVMADIVKSWGVASAEHAFVLRRSSLHPLTTQRLVPGQYPVREGYVQWESKSGKWSKRWMEVRSGSVFLAKNEKGKESAFLCSSTTFDVYRVLQVIKAPKHFVFALKSDEPSTIFENADDYMHTFCCDEAFGATVYSALHSAKSVAMLQRRPVQVESASEIRRPAAEPLVSFQDGNIFSGTGLLARGSRR